MATSALSFHVRRVVPGIHNTGDLPIETRYCQGIHPQVLLPSPCEPGRVYLVFTICVFSRLSPDYLSMFIVRELEPSFAL